LGKAGGNRHVARIYAGVLAVLAFITVVVRNVFDCGGVESSLAIALAAMLVFYAIGYVVGRLAEVALEQAFAPIVSSGLDTIRSEKG